MRERLNQSIHLPPWYWGGSKRYDICTDGSNLGLEVEGGGWLIYFVGLRSLAAELEERTWMEKITVCRSAAERRAQGLSEAQQQAIHRSLDEHGVALVPPPSAILSAASSYSPRI